MKDHRLVRIAIFLFFVAISLVYAVFVQVSGESLRSDLVRLVQKYNLSTSTPMQPIGSGSVDTGSMLSGSVTTGMMQIDDEMTLDDDTSFLDEVL
jgi:hypothetical protein